MIVQAVVDLLKAVPNIASIVGDRIYPVEAPDAATFPLVVVTKAGGVGETDMQGEAGLEGARVQIDCYAIGYAEMVSLRTVVRRFLQGYQGGPPYSGGACAIQGAFCINDLDLPDSTMKRAGPRLRRRMLEFRIWNTEI
jgi:hypothetical protein